MSFSGFHGDTRLPLCIQTCSGGVHPVEKLCHSIMELAQPKQCTLQVVLAAHPFRVDLMPQNVHFVQLVCDTWTITSCTPVLQCSSLATNILHFGGHCLKSHLKLLLQRKSCMLRAHSEKAPHTLYSSIWAWTVSRSVPTDPIC